MLQAAKTAITSINGMYRSMWTAGWSTGGNTHQCFGIAAYNMAQDAMASGKLTLWDWAYLMMAWLYTWMISSSV